MQVDGRVISVVAGLIALVAYQIHSKPERWTNGRIVAQNPQQDDLSEPRLWKHKGYTIRALADYKIRGRVVQKQGYGSGRESELSPLDIGMAWGPASDQRVLDRATFTLSDRYLSFFPQENCPMDGDQIGPYAGNIHLIPATELVERHLNSVHFGQGIQLKGSLVEIESADGWHWKSSLTRTDSGPGACEVMWVESVATL